ncbi:MAG: hypothetical protein RL243_997, partial [Actinomycetota bacterium]
FAKFYYVSNEDGDDYCCFDALADTDQICCKHFLEPFHTAVYG